MIDYCKDLAFALGHYFGNKAGVVIASFDYYGCVDESIAKKCKEEFIGGLEECLEKGVPAGIGVSKEDIEFVIKIASEVDWQDHDQFKKVVELCNMIKSKSKILRKLEKGELISDEDVDEVVEYYVGVGKYYEAGIFLEEIGKPEEAVDIYERYDLIREALEVAERSGLVNYVERMRNLV